MGDSGSLMNIGDLSKPAVVLVERISDAVSGFFKPCQIVRVAKAEAAAELIRANADIEVTDLHRRAIHRFVDEEAKRQDNMEAIAAGTLFQIDESSRPQDMDEDWITNYFDKCRIVSDKEMQTLWSAVLTREANSPGAFSRRTVNLLADLDKPDAELFVALSRYCWDIGGPTAVVFDIDDGIYAQNGITFQSLTDLEALGLVMLAGALQTYSKMAPSRSITVSYHGSPLTLQLPEDSDKQLKVGKVLLTRAGVELAAVCASEPVERFFDYARTHWLELATLE